MRLVSLFAVLAAVAVVVVLQFGGERARPSHGAAADVASSPSSVAVPAPPVADAAPSSPSGEVPLPPAADATVVPEPVAADVTPSEPIPADAPAAPPPPPDGPPPDQGRTPPAADAAREPHGAKPISHAVEGMENCVACHQAGQGCSRMPRDHADYTNETCQACHAPGAP